MDALKPMILHKVFLHLPNNLIVDDETNCNSGFHSRQIAAANWRVRNPAYNTGVICWYKGDLSPWRASK